MSDFELDVVSGCYPPQLPEGASDDGIHGSSRVYGCNCGPVVTEDEDCGASEGREPAEVCFGGWVEGDGASLETKILAPVVHLVEWKSLPRKLWNFFTRMEVAADRSRQNDLASSTLRGSIAMVSRMVSKTTPIQVIMVVGPWHLSSIEGTRHNQFLQGHWRGQ